MRTMHHEQVIYGSTGTQRSSPSRLIVRHVIGHTVLALAISGQPLVAQAPGTPVPPSLLNGRTLTVQHLGFSIDAPEVKWSWTQASNPEQFHCSSPDGTKRFSVVVVIPEKPRPLDRAEADGYIDGFTETQQRRGFKVDRKGCAGWSGVPSGFRCSVSGKTGDQTVVQYIAYIVSTTRFYSISHLGLGTVEPSEFTAFAASFKLFK